MPAFAYRAVDARGRNAHGIIDAPSAVAARATLRGRSLLPVSVEPTVEKAARPGGLLPARSIGTRALSLMTRQLSILIGSGIRVEDALRTVADQTRQPKVAALLLNLRASVLDGQSFARALNAYPGTFATYYRASVSAGESAGQLGTVMEHLSGFVEARARNRQTIQLALLYPTILAIVAMSVIVALLTFVVPDIVRVFTSRGVQLPFLTRALIAVSAFVNAWGLVVAALVAVAAAGAAWLLRRPGPRLAWHRLLATSPLTRSFSLKSNAAQFAGTLATLTVSRVPLAEALAAAAQTVPNLYIRGKVDGVSTRVQEGVALSAALNEAGVFPPMLIAMVGSGEAGGVLGATLTRAAEDQMRDLNALVAALVGLVEPAVLLLMGGIVMVLVLAILMPIINLNNLVR